jgi:uncharacterized protein
MNHLESSFTGKNSLWRYIVMFVAVILAANTLGAIPLLITLAIKSLQNPEIAEKFSQDQSNMSLLGIDPNLGFFIILIPFIAGLIVFILLLKPIHEKSFTIIVNGTGKIRWKRFFAGGLVWFFLSSAYLIVYMNLDPLNFSIHNNSKTLILLIVISLLLIPLQSSFEEIFFRGYLMQGFALIVRSRWFPLVMTSVLFGLLHSFNPEVKKFGFFTMMPHYVLFGLIFGIITIFDDGIETAMGAHSVNNIFISIFLTHESSALQTAALYEQHNIFPWMEFAGLVVMGIIYILIMKRLLGWGGLRILFEKIGKKPLHSEAKNPNLMN